MPKLAEFKKKKMTLNGCQEASNAIVLPKYILSPCSKSKGVEELSKAYC